MQDHNRLPDPPSVIYLDIEPALAKSEHLERIQEAAEAIEDRHYLFAKTQHHKLSKRMSN